MANAPFDRVNIGFREKPVSDDHNRAASQDARTLAYLVGRLLGGRASDASEALALRDAFHGTGLAIAASSPVALNVRVTAGLGWHYLPSDIPSDIGSPDLLGVDDLAELKPIYLAADHVFAAPTAPAGPNTRIDIVEVEASRALIDSETRRQFNDATGSFDPHAFYKTLSFALDGLVGTVNAPAESTAPLSYKVGVAANPGLVPATSAGYLKLAEVLIGSAVTTIGQGDIIDRRRLLGPGGVVRCGVSFRLEWNGGAPIVTILRSTMPPGVRFGVAGQAAARAQARIYIAAGEIVHAVSISRVRARTFVASGVQMIGTVELPILVSGDYVQTVDSSLKAAAAASTPALLVGVGTKLVAFETQGRFINDTGAGTTDVDNTNAALEDVIIDATVDLAYHA
jgi:hypothetical protein